MTWNDASAEPLMDRIQLLHKGSLLLFTMLVGLLMALNRHDAVVLGVIGVLGTILIPLLHVVLRRLLVALRQRETENRIIMQTREYLRNQEAWSPLSAAQAESTEVIGRRMTPRGFKDVFAGVAASLPGGAPVVFGAWSAQAAKLPAMLPAPATEPLSELP